MYFSAVDDELEKYLTEATAMSLYSFSVMLGFVSLSIFPCLGFADAFGKYTETSKGPSGNSWIRAGDPAGSTFRRTRARK